MDAFKKKHKVVSVSVFPNARITTNNNTTNNLSSLHNSMKMVLTIAQVFTLMPLYGIREPTIDSLVFKWRCFKTIASIISSLLIFINAFLFLLEFIREDLEFNYMVATLFYLLQTTGYILFIRLAKQWFHLNKEWLAMEKAMEKYPRPPNNYRRCIVFTVVIMSLAFAEHLFSILKAVHASRGCPIYKTEPWKAFFSVSCKNVFSITSYAHWKAFIAEIPVVMGTFHWNFMDLFLILVSAALAERFRQLNRYVTKSEIKDENFWKQTRIDYTRLWTLCKTLDNSVNHFVTLSFGSNLFFICWQMFNSLKPMRGLLQTIYFFFSLGYLIGRTATVSVYCCWINDESKEMLSSLFNLPSENFSKEVDRLIQQICSSPPALTGSNYFAVTRGLCLQVAGAVITFEIILMQIGPSFLKTDTEHSLFCLT